jgi:membrane fusion protein (multidrug efflux system)
MVMVVVLAGYGCSKGAPEAGQKPGPGGQAGKMGPKGAEDPKGGVEALPVSVISTERGNIDSVMIFSSNVDSERQVKIYPMSSGILEEILRDEGDRVKKGDVLARLDDREAGLNEEKARLNLQQLAAELKRQTELFEKNMISEDAFEKLKFSTESARLDWQTKKLLLSYTRITTPISGMVSRREIKAGNKVNVSDLAFSVIDTEEKIAVVHVPEQNRRDILIGQKAVLSAPGVEIPAAVKRFSPAVDPESGTVKVTVAAADPKNALAIGQFVNVRLIRSVHQNALLINKDALVFEGGKVFVFKMNEDQTVAKVEVKTDFESGFKAEIVSGLTDGDQVVTAGKSSIKDGDKVKVIASPVTNS